MASFYHFALVVAFLLLIHPTSGTTRKLSALVKEQPLTLKYHNGLFFLKGNLTVNLIWYGKFTPIQRSILIDFLQSLNSHRVTTPPSVASWWKMTEKYKGVVSSNVVLGKQILDENYSLGRLLKDSNIVGLASSKTFLSPRDAGHSINVVFTAKDVGVDRFCMSRCGTHGSSGSGTSSKFAYVWVGNAETQCPGQCAWPFHQPIYGPQTAPLVSPNGDVGVDGMVINLATVLAGTVTNPFKNGYYQGSADAPLEAVSACTGVFGKGAYPGYPGEICLLPVQSHPIYSIPKPRIFGLQQQSLQRPDFANIKTSTQPETLNINPSWWPPLDDVMVNNLGDSHRPTPPKPADHEPLYSPKTADEEETPLPKERELPDPKFAPGIPPDITTCQRTPTGVPLVGDEHNLPPGTAALENLETSLLKPTDPYLQYATCKRAPLKTNPKFGVEYRNPYVEGWRPRDDVLSVRSIRRHKYMASRFMQAGEREGQFSGRDRGHSFHTPVYTPLCNRYRQHPLGSPPRPPRHPYATTWQNDEYGSDYEEEQRPKPRRKGKG
ncbi:hypothetical protein GIB67_031394 [Kingdonia uniflora]|uniref:Protein EXORDIUM-like 2 n=1 Tax=Kingdonia uniflora TaxID=39325 RepID=A0A7J7MB65_9MAGN|nr:hypothetical protein GIB67_031394 [Kingdonia uniflora]